MHGAGERSVADARAPRGPYPSPPRSASGPRGFLTVMIGSPPLRSPFPVPPALSVFIRFSVRSNLHYSPKYIIARSNCQWAIDSIELTPYASRYSRSSTVLYSGRGVFERSMTGCDRTFSITCTSNAASRWSEGNASWVAVHGVHAAEPRPLLQCSVSRFNAFDPQYIFVI